jgi:hypothetical protein
VLCLDRTRFQRKARRFHLRNVVLLLPTKTLVKFINGQHFRLKERLLKCFVEIILNIKIFHLANLFGPLHYQCYHPRPSQGTFSGPLRTAKSILREPPVREPQFRSSAFGFGLPGLSFKPHPLRTPNVSTPFCRRSTTHPFSPLAFRHRSDERPKTKDQDGHWFPCFMPSPLSRGTFFVFCRKRKSPRVVLYS